MIPCTPTRIIGRTSITGDDPITVTGTGSSSNPYRVGLCLSTLPGNTLTIDPDGCLYAAGGDGVATVITAGANVTVTGAGTAADPYIISSTGGGQTFLEAGDQIGITGTGTQADPYVITSTDTVTAVTGGNGILVGTTTADPTVYVVAADISSDAGNRLTLGSDTGLYAAPIDPTPVTAGANITVTGAGTTASPYVIASTGPLTSITAGTNVTITGTGTAADPYVINSTSEQSDTEVQAGDGISVTGDGTGADPYIVAADLSTDTGNTLTLGTDGALYVPAGAVTAITGGANVTVTGAGTAADPYVIASTDTIAAVTAGANVTVTGTGTSADPYVIASTDTVTILSAGTNVTITGTGSAATPYVISSTDTDTITTVTGDNGVTVTGSPTAGYLVEADLSADAPNLLQLGTDGGLYVPGVYAYGSSNTAPVPTGRTYFTPTILNATTGDFTLNGREVVVTRAGVYVITVHVRHTSTITTTASPPTGHFTVSIDIGGADTLGALSAVVGPNSSGYGHTYTWMDSLPAGQTVEFWVSRSATAWSSDPTSSCRWSMFRLGPAFA